MQVLAIKGAVTAAGTKNKESVYVTSMDGGNAGYAGVFSCQWIASCRGASVMESRRREGAYAYT